VVAGTSANAEIGTPIARLRDRTRDLVRNNPYAAKAVQAVVSNLVGTGIMPRPRGVDATVNDQADTLWARFAEACDADGLTDFSALRADRPHAGRKR
jgi:capsid protein